MRLSWQDFRHRRAWISAAVLSIAGVVIAGAVFYGSGSDQYFFAQVQQSSCLHAQERWEKEKACDGAFAYDCPLRCRGKVDESTCSQNCFNLRDICKKSLAPLCAGESSYCRVPDGNACNNSCVYSQVQVCWPTCKTVNGPPDKECMSKCFNENAKCMNRCNPVCTNSGVSSSKRASSSVSSRKSQGMSSSTPLFSCPINTACMTPQDCILKGNAKPDFTKGFFETLTYCRGQLKTGNSGYCCGFKSSASSKKPFGLSSSSRSSAPSSLTKVSSAPFTGAPRMRITFTRAESTDPAAEAQPFVLVDGPTPENPTRAPTKIPSGQWVAIDRIPIKPVYSPGPYLNRGTLLLDGRMTPVIVLQFHPETWSTDKQYATYYGTLELEGAAIADAKCRRDGYIWYCPEREHDGTYVAPDDDEVYVENGVVHFFLHTKNVSNIEGNIDIFYTYFATDVSSSTASSVRSSIVSSRNASSTRPCLSGDVCISEGSCKDRGGFLKDQGTCTPSGDVKAQIIPSPYHCCQLPSSRSSVSAPSSSTLSQSSTFSRAASSQSSCPQSAPITANDQLSDYKTPVKKLFGDRFAIVQAPTVWNKKVIVALHGGEQSADAWYDGDLNQGSFVSDALKQGYLIVAPDSVSPFCPTRKQWDSGANSKDLPFMENVFSWLKADLGAQKVFVVGISSGGFMAERLATTYPESIVALVIHSAGSPENAIIDQTGDCNRLFNTNTLSIAPGHPPTYILHGVIDQIVPYEIGKNLYAALLKAGIKTSLDAKPIGFHQWYAEKNQDILSWLSAQSPSPCSSIPRSSASSRSSQVSSAAPLSSTFSSTGISGSRMRVTITRAESTDPAYGVQPLVYLPDDRATASSGQWFTLEQWPPDMYGTERGISLLGAGVNLGRFRVNPSDYRHPYSGHVTFYGTIEVEGAAITEIICTDGVWYCPEKYKDGVTTEPDNDEVWIENGKIRFALHAKNVRNSEGSLDQFDFSWTVPASSATSVHSTPTGSLCPDANGVYDPSCRPVMPLPSMPIFFRNWQSSVLSGTGLMPYVAGTGPVIVVMMIVGLVVGWMYRRKR